MEYLAQKWADRCRFEHPDHSKFPEYGGTGQNIAMSSGHPTMAELSSAWWKERNYYHFDKNTCDPGRMCGHYTQVCCKYAAVYFVLSIHTNCFCLRWFGPQVICLVVQWHRVTGTFFLSVSTNPRTLSLKWLLLVIFDACLSFFQMHILFKLQR